MKSKSCTRRQFLERTTAVGAGVAISAIGCAAGMTKVVTLATPDQGGRVVVDTSQHRELDAVGGAIQILTGGQSFILVRSNESEFRALSAVCTHLGCEVRHNRFGFRCPCHGSAFDYTGKAITGPATESLASYPIVMEGGRLIVLVNS